PTGGGYLTYFFTEPVILVPGEQATFGYAVITLVEVNNVTQRAVFAVEMNPTLSATPLTGPPPLTVSFTAVGGDFLDFGDGFSTTTCSTCAAEWTASHTYTSSGTFSAQLRQGSSTIATATITVGSPNGPTITSINTNHSVPGATIRIQGSKFTASNTISLAVGNGEPVTIATVAANGGSIFFQLPLSQASGAYVLTIKNENGTSNTVVLNVAAASNAPQLTNVVPEPVAAGGTLYITGTNFDDVNFVYVDGALQPGSELAGPTSLRFVVPSSVGAGAHSLVVANSKGASAAKSFTVGAAAKDCSSASGPCASLSINGQKTFVYLSGQYTLTWNSKNVFSCNLTWAPNGGMYFIAPNTTGSGPSGLIGSYTLSCNGGGGGNTGTGSAVTDTVTIVQGF
ncbi:MAG: IPT/TIG domain-containing protein, partial [bacterium]|nr:IPT/TIG domain-containing protein [bacterium]